ncbi:MAG TPA: hypothetical protein VMZ71_04740 [Gemmataceae bacterium]|nr:hypothetical protein [Gemmataceae bacterium]
MPAPNFRVLEAALWAALAVPILLCATAVVLASWTGADEFPLASRGRRFVASTVGSVAGLAVLAGYVWLGSGYFWSLAVVACVVLSAALAGGLVGHRAARFIASRSA